MLEEEGKMRPVRRRHQERGQERTQRDTLTIELTDKIRGRQLEREQRKIILSRSTADILRIVAVADLEYLKEKLASTCHLFFEGHIDGNKKMSKKAKAQIVDDMRNWVNTPAPDKFQNNTAVILAAKYFEPHSHMLAIKELVGYGADINAQNSDGDAVVHLTFKDQSTIKKQQRASNLMLLCKKFGANPFLLNKEGESALTFCNVLSARFPESTMEFQLVYQSEYTYNDFYDSNHKLKKMDIPAPTTLSLIQRFEAERPRVRGDESSCIVM